MSTKHSLLAALVLAGATLGVPARAAAEPDSRWLPWLGCWQAVTAATAPGEAAVPAAEAATGSFICVRATSDGAGVDVLTVADGKTVSEQRIVADGTRRPVETSGCKGWETATWSQDNRRVFLRSELSCEGMIGRATSGIIGLLPNGQWLDIEVLAAGEGKATRVERFRQVDPARAGQSPVAPGKELAIETARAAAGADLSLDDVREAVTKVDTEAVEALLIERQARLALNAEQLVQLKEGGVPGSVIDLMVALSYPRVFAVNRSTGEADRVATADDRYRGTRGRRGMRPYFTPYGWDWMFWDYYGYPYRYGRYGRYNPYGYDYYGYNPWSYGGGGSVIIVKDGDQARDAGGQAVKGRGYTRRSGDRSTSDTSPAPAPDRSSSGKGSSGSSSSTGSSGSGSSGSGSSGSSSGERTAKPRCCS